MHPLHGPPPCTRSEPDTGFDTLFLALLSPPTCHCWMRKGDCTTGGTKTSSLGYRLSTHALSFLWGDPYGNGCETVLWDFFFNMYMRSMLFKRGKVFLVYHCSCKCCCGPLHRYNTSVIECLRQLIVQRSLCRDHIHARRADFTGTLCSDWIQTSSIVCFDLRKVSGWKSDW